MNHTFTPKYQTSIVFCMVTSAIGWLLMLGSIVFGLIQIRTVEFTAYIVVILYLLVAGFVMVMAGQMSKAILDNTNANREILHILKSRTVSGLNRVEPTLAHPPESRDRVKNDPPLSAND